MPDYARPFGMAGGLAGGAAGAAGGGLLGQMLGGLNMPRNALWAMPGRLAHGDLLGAAPGLAGLAAGGLTAATGVGLPFAGLVGSAVGGLGEGIEESMRPDMEKAPESSDLVKQLGGDPDSFGGQALGMGLSMAGDPLSYAGGLGGEAAGKAAGEAGGHFLEGAAAARGPRYPGGPEKLTGLLDQLGGMNPAQAEQFQQNVPKLLQSPEASRLLQEIEPGSTAEASGMYGLVLRRRSDGGVTRISIPENGPGGGPNWSAPPPDPRAVDPAMLQNVRDRALGATRVEQLPSATFGKFDWQGRPQDDLADLINQSAGPLSADVASRGGLAQDMHGMNMGRLPSGNIAITDPDNIILPTGQTTPEKIPQAPPQGWFTNKLLDLLGADKGVQGDISRGIAQGGGSAGLSPEQIAAWQQARQDAFATAGTRPGGGAIAGPPPGSPVLGPNVGLHTNQDEQVGELMKALGLTPGGGSPAPAAEKYGLLDAMEGRVPGLTDLPKAQPTGGPGADWPPVQGPRSATIYGEPGGNTGERFGGGTGGPEPLSPLNDSGLHLELPPTPAPPPAVDPVLHQFMNLPPNQQRKWLADMPPEMRQRIEELMQPGGRHGDQQPMQNLHLSDLLNQLIGGAGDARTPGPGGLGTM